MALEPINVGLIPNDGTGDDLRSAFIKINQNFEELELQGGQSNTISNIGTGAGLYKEKIGVDLRLKSLVAGPGITITNNSSDVTITNNRNMIVTVNSNNGSLTASSPTQAINIVGGTGITTSINPSTSTLTITGNNYDIETDTSPKLGGNLNLNGFSIIGGTGTNVTAQTFTGNLTGNVTGNLTGNVNGLVNGINIADLQTQLLTFDFGPLPSNTVPASTNYSNPIQFLLANIMIDMGTITNPSVMGIDGGTFV